MSTETSSSSQPKPGSQFWKTVKAMDMKDIKTLTGVTLNGIKGDPIDDKQYVMEHIIQAVAELPSHSRLSDTLTNKFLSELWDDLPHPPQSYLGYDYVFRKADGSNNNIMWPHIGKAGQPYARSVRPKKMQPPRPDPSLVYDSVLARKEFRPHPNAISSVLFYIASIIIHDCFHTSHEDYAISETSSYLDLAPLYGSNEEQQMAVRTKSDGKLKPDCFSDSRIHAFPPGVGVMLIMFNRFHNQVVENLAAIDEGGRFSSILARKTRQHNGVNPHEQNQKSPEELYDEALFQTARLVTTGLYINIVLQDYVRTILGLNRADTKWNLDPRAPYDHGLFGTKIPQAGGNQVSAEFSLIYRWHACVSQRDERWTDTLVAKVGTKPDPITAAMRWQDDLAHQAPFDRQFDELTRGEDGKYSDDDLAKIWLDSVEDVAGSFGAAHVPENLKFVEVLSMIQARRWNLASLNEFREYFKLKPHDTFESINPDPVIAEQLKRLYGHPDNVELYPGVVVESAKIPMSPGSGLCASWTISRAILADAVALVRGDRFYTIDYTPSSLTNFGFQTASYDLDVDGGSVIHKLILNALPHHVPQNSVYAHFPLVNPGANKEIQTSLKKESLYSYERPTGPLPETSSEDTDPVALALTVLNHSMHADHWEDSVDSFYNKALSDGYKNDKYNLGKNQIIDIVSTVNAAHAAFIEFWFGVKVTEKEHGDIECAPSAELQQVLGQAQANAIRRASVDIANWMTGSTVSTEGRHGLLALEKLFQSAGFDHDASDTASLLSLASFLYSVLACCTTAIIEQAFPVHANASKNTQPAPFITIPATLRREMFNVDLDTIYDDANIIEFKLDLAFAVRVAKIVKAEVLGKILEPLKDAKRVPGSQGQIKKVYGSIHGEVKYVNNIESELLPHPVSMKLMW